jgi:hypothetical protein
VALDQDPAAALTRDQDAQLLVLAGNGQPIKLPDEPLFPSSCPSCPLCGTFRRITIHKEDMRNRREKAIENRPR